MTAPHADQLIDGYLARLRSAASDLPKGTREELIADVRSHIAEARGREREESDATVLNLLDRIGEPSVVVADARERLGLRLEPPYRPGFLEVAAIVLLPVFWPIGVILLWMSPAWNLRDKLIGTFLPPGGYIGMGLIGVLAVHGQAGGCEQTYDPTGHLVSNTCPSGAIPLLSVLVPILLTILIYIGPLLPAAYLGIRLRWGRRAMATAVP